ncbi:MAG: DUF485 domain-containing protein [Armatimonadota bacterium]
MTYEQMQARQLRLSVLLAVIFLATVFSVPFLNAAFPDQMLTPVLGIPFVWLLVGVVFHLEFWIIALVYTIYSNRWEEEMTDGE